MTQPTTNTPPSNVTRDSLCDALRILGLDPNNTTKVVITPSQIEVEWDEAQYSADAADRFVVHHSVIEISR